MTRLVERARTTATGAYQIRAHGDVYQVVPAPYRADATPVHTSRDLDAARAWIDRQGTPPRIGRPPRAPGGSAVTLRLRATAAESERWRAAAEADGVSLTQLIREAVEARLARGGAR